MPPYTSLFGPRRMKPNPSASEAIRDPLGRDRHLWDQEQEETDLDGQLEAARADWRKDASLNSLFGVNGAFRLEDTVGKAGKNRPGDVFKVQSLLHREGLLDAGKTDGPTGFLGIYDHEAIQKFQKENGLKQDGWMGPNGETIKAFEEIYTPPPNTKPKAMPEKHPIDLLDGKALNEMLLGLPASSRPKLVEVEPMDETLTGGSGEDDITSMQLAQQAETSITASEEKRSPSPDEIPARYDAWPESPHHIDFRDELAKREVKTTAKEGYAVGNEEKGPLGRYQFTGPALREVELLDAKGQWNSNNKFGVQSRKEFLNSPEAQEKALSRFLEKNEKHLEKTEFKAAIGSTIQGVRAEFKISESGLMAATHREGIGMVDAYLQMQKMQKWKSDFGAIPDEISKRIKDIQHPKDKRLPEAILRSVETRMREFIGVPYRPTH